jgi:hypothetical protein
MNEIKQVVLAQGLSAVIPSAWELFAESDDGALSYAIGMKSETCNANFELLNNGAVTPKEFISSYRFSLMQGLIELGADIHAVDSKYSDELIATKDGITGKIFHTFIATNPVAHISAIFQSESDLVELRFIRESIIVDHEKLDSSEEDFVPMRISDQWQRSIASS